MGQISERQKKISKGSDDGSKISVVCACGKKYKVAAADLGGKFTCRACGEKVVIATASEPKPAEPKPAAKPVAPAQPRTAKLARAVVEAPRRRGSVAKKLVIALLVAGLGGGVASGAYFITHGSKPTPALAKLAPANAMLWLESQKPSRTLEAWKKTKGYEEYLASKTHENVDKAWKEIAAEAQKSEGWKELGLGADEHAAMLLLGQDVALGVLPAKGEGAPRVVLMTELDVVGLAKDMALQGDVTKVWGKLTKALGGDAKETYEGCPILKKHTSGGDITLTLIGATLVASCDEQAIKDVIDVRAKKAPALADAPAFAREVDALPRQVAAFGWVDMTFARSPERIGKTVRAIADSIHDESLKSFDPSVLQPLADDLKPIDGLAAAATLPEGDLYAMELSVSRKPEDVFADAAEIDPRGLVPDDVMVYGEARGLWDLAASFPSSPGWKTIANTEAAAWIQHKIQNPGELKQLVPGGRGLEALDKDATFETKLGFAMIAAGAHELLGNDLAVAATMSDDAKIPVDGVAFVRARPVARIACDLLSGFAAQQSAKSPGAAPAPVAESPVAVELAKSVGNLMKSAEGFRHFSKNAQKNEKGQVRVRLVAVEIEGEVEGDAAAFGQALKKGLASDGYAVEDGKLALGVTCKVMGVGNGGALIQMKLVDQSSDFARTLFSTSAMVPGRGRGGLAFQPPVFEVASHGGRKVFGCRQGEAGAFWTQLGSRLVIANRRASVESAIDRAAAAKKTPGLEKAIQHLPEGYSLFVYADLRGRERTKKMLGGQSPDAMKWIEQLQDSSGSQSFAMYVAKDYGSVTFRGWSTWGEKTDAGLKALATNASPEPAVWKTIPAETILSSTMNLDPKATYAFALSGAKAFLGEKTTNDLLAAAKEWAGKDVETLIGSLGRSHGFALVVQDRLVPEGAPAEAADEIAAVPAAILALELQDASFEPTLVELARKAVKDVNDSREKRHAEMEKLTGQQIRPAPQPIVLEEKKAAGKTIYRLRTAEEQMTQGIVGGGYAPCFAVAGKFLLVSTSEAALVRAIQAQSGASLASSPVFARVVGDTPRTVTTFTYASAAGLIDQIDKDADLIARNATPPPADLGPAPEMPPFPSGEQDPQAFEKFQKTMTEYQAKQRDYMKKLADYRKTAGAANAAQMRKIVGSLRVLGGVVSATVAKDEGSESFTTFRLDPAAAQPAAK